VFGAEHTPASLALMHAVRRGVLASLPSASARVYMALLSLHETTQIQVSHVKLGELAGVSRRGLVRAVAALQARKLVARDASPRRATVYRCPAIAQAAAELDALKIEASNATRRKLGTGHRHAA
jgi:hypothetical protein